MNQLFSQNEAKYRLLRTIIQGVIGVLVANVDLLISGFSIAPEVKALIVALVMAILSPIMAAMGAPEDLPEDYFEDEDDFEDEEEYEDADS